MEEKQKQIINEYKIMAKDNIIEIDFNELKAIQCPITFITMQNPVIAPDNHTYDRNSLQKWYDQGNRLCPLNPSITLTDPSQLPVNYTVRDIIEEYQSKSNNQKSSENSASINR